MFYLFLASSLLEGELKVVTHSDEGGRGPVSLAQWVPLGKTRELTHMKVRWDLPGVGNMCGWGDAWGNSLAAASTEDGGWSQVVLSFRCSLDLDGPMPSPEWNWPLFTKRLGLEVRGHSLVYICITIRSVLRDLILVSQSIHSFTPQVFIEQLLYLLSSYCVLSTVLGSRYTVANKFTF